MIGDTREAERARPSNTQPDQDDARVRLASLIAGTYDEMPGLCLRLNQAVRLFGLEDETCRQVLDDLISAGRLRMTRDGAYAKA